MKLERVQGDRLCERAEAPHFVARPRSLAFSLTPTDDTTEDGPMDRVPITPEGAARMQADLAHLKEVVRPRIVRDLEEARAHGDISENSEYEDAKHRQALCEGRIAEISSQLAMLEIIDVRRLPPSERVVFGATVTMEDQETEEETTYRIVGNYEADVKAGLISVTSPIGKALIGKSQDDEVVVQTPRGTRRFIITNVQYK